MHFLVMHPACVGICLIDGHVYFNFNLNALISIGETSIRVCGFSSFLKYIRLNVDSFKSSTVNGSKISWKVCYIEKRRNVLVFLIKTTTLAMDEFTFRCLFKLTIQTNQLNPSTYPPFATLLLEMTIITNPVQ